MMRRFSIILICILVAILLCSCSKLQGKAGSKNDASRTTGEIVLYWGSETERGYYGFNVYRGESRDGPYVKINKEIVHVAETTGTPKQYVYVDKPLEIGKVYYYYIESVSYAGTTEEITPRAKVIVKPIIDESQQEVRMENKQKSR
jgi:hypothetical protein